MQNLFVFGNITKILEDGGDGKWREAWMFLNKTSTAMESLHVTNNSGTERQMHANIKKWDSKMYQGKRTLRTILGLFGWPDQESTH